VALCVAIRAVSKRNRSLTLKRGQSAQSGHSLAVFAARELLYFESEGETTRSGRTSAGAVRVNSMTLSLKSSFVVLLRQGGVGGANRNDRRLWRSVRFAPVGGSTDTARPADL
jgi:hypothetical protein